MYVENFSDGAFDTAVRSGTGAEIDQADEILQVGLDMLRNSGFLHNIIRGTEMLMQLYPL